MSSEINRRKSQAGRPPTTTADTIKTLAWIRCIKLQSGKNPYQLGVEFHPQHYRYDVGKYQSSKRWERYANGDSNPPDPKTGSSLIDIVERAYPGTARIFRHTLWIALRGKIKDSAEISRLLLTLDRSVIDICFVPEIGRNKATLKRTPYDYGMPTRLSYLKSTDCLAALLLLGKEAELTGNSRSHAQIFHMVYETLSYVRHLPEIQPVLKEIVDCINGSLQSHRYHLSDGIVVPAPVFTVEAISNDSERTWPRDENTHLQHKLYEKLSNLFSSTETFRTWLFTHHPLLGESPHAAMEHPQGLRAIQALLSE